MSLVDTDRAPEPRLRRVWSWLGRPSTYVGSMLVVIAYRVWLYLMVGRWSGLRGDEVYYWSTARRTLRLIGIEDPGRLTRSDLASDIVSRGWFLPGMGGVLAPLRVFSDTRWVGRIWIGVLSVLLLLWLVRRIRQMYSTQAAVMVLLIVGLLPYTAWFSFTFWGGHLGGLIMVLNLLFVVRLCRRIRVGIDPGWRPFVLLGVSVAVNVYIRPTTLGQVLPMAAMLFAAYSAHHSFWPAFKRSFSRWAVVFFVFALLFAPWTTALMIKFDGPFLVVTSRPLASILRSAPDEEIERVGSSFGEWHLEMLRLQEERGQGYYEVVTTEQARYAREQSTSEKLHNVSRGMRRFYDLENQFLSSAIDDANNNDDRTWFTNQTEQRFKARYLRVNSIAWLLLTVTTIGVLVRRWQFWDADGWLGIVLRAAMVMALFQPLTGGPHGRHINFLVPLFVVSVALAVDHHMTERERPSDASRWPWLERPVGTAFAAIILGFVAFYFAI